ncbi:MAG TPA: hypothetical protein VGM63_04445 [Mucilaginibacter sp.]|jgi:hypothetical protein
METEETLFQKSGSSLIDKEELKSFYKSNLPKILKSIFFEPVNGTYTLFSKLTDKTYAHSLILMASTTILYIIIPYMLMGEQLREVAGFSGAFKTGVGILIFMLAVSVIAFGIKAISGKPNFKNELLTGALCGIPLIILLVLAIVAKMFAGDDSAEMMTDPTAMFGKMGVLLLLVFYIFLMLINILQQSLRAAGAKDALCWYLSPAGIFLAGYISFKIMAAMF